MYADGEEERNSGQGKKESDRDSGNYQHGHYEVHNDRYM